MATTTNFGWETPDDTDLVKDGALAMRTLGNGIDTSLVDLKGGTTGQILSKASNTDLDFSWVADAGGIAPTILDAKGDLIAASAADTPARLAVGNNGETLVPDSSTSTGLRWQPIQTRNLVYNSAMDIWQRGTSFTASGYCADRWYAAFNGATGRTISQQTGTDQFRYVQRIQRNSGNATTTALDFGQSFEIADATQYAGKTVTVSFYARKGADFSGASSNLPFYVYSGTSSTEANRVTTAYASGGATAGSGTATLTTTLTRYQTTFTFGSTVTQFAILFTLNWAGTASTNDYVDITGVQLEVGSVATNFTRQSGTLAGELAACQRYYIKLGGNSASEAIGSAYATSTTNARVWCVLPVQLRTAPTALDFSTLGFFDGGGSIIAISTATVDQASNKTPYMIMTTAGSLTANRPMNLHTNASTSGYLAFSAEL